METLVADAGDGLSLNIVCNGSKPTKNASKRTSEATPPGKKKKRNRYEIRRYKARIAKEEKLLAKKGIIDSGVNNSEKERGIISNGDDNATKQKHDLPPTDTVNSSNCDISIVNTDTETNRETNIVSEEEHSKKKEIEGVRLQEENAVSADAEACENRSVTTERNIDIGHTDDQISVEINKKNEKNITTSRSLENVDHDRKSSRRFHENDNNLADMETRAKYMAEFHAHPLEIDRRSGAVSNIKASTSSSHIFMLPDEEKFESKDAENDDDDTLTEAQRLFTALGLNKRLSRAVTSERGPFRLFRPTVIQAKSIGTLLTSNDNKNEIDRTKNVIIQSETGSGKTLAYLLPILQNIVSSTEQNTNIRRSTQKLRSIIILPTRELAVQTFQTTLRLTLKSYSSSIVPVCLSGGEKRKSEKARLRKGLSFLIGTPGRLLDHLQKTECLRGSLEKNNMFDWFILDEADRLLDIGLGHQVKEILGIIHSLVHSDGKQQFRSLLVSATVTDEMRELLTQDMWKCNNTKNKDKKKQEWLLITASAGEDVRYDKSNTNKSPTDEIGGKISSLSNATPRQLMQQHMVVSAKLRLPALVAFLLARVKQGQRVVVFMSTCDGVDYHYNLFSSVDSFLFGVDNKEKRENAEVTKGIFGKYCKLYRLHGNVIHTERTKIVDKFGSDSTNGKSNSVGSSKILFATDVAARGLNLPGVDWIVQYDPPCEIADYVHRAGRTARAGKAGNAVLFLLPSEHQYVEVLKLKGLKDTSNSALSLSSTLQQAAELCPHLSRRDEAKTPGGKKIGNRSGETFAFTLQSKLEEHLLQDTMKQKDAMKRNSSSKTDTTQAAESDFIGLQDFARKAFTSFLRAYPTKEKAVRHIFSARALHLGHVARSFALKDPPKVLTRARSKKNPKNKVKSKDDDSGNISRKRNANLAFDEDGKQSHDNAKKLYRISQPKILKGKFDDYIDGDNMTESSKVQPPDDAKRKMLYAAKKIQSGNMEFF